MVMTARVQLGLVDPKDLIQDEAEGEGEESEGEESEGGGSEDGASA